MTASYTVTASGGGFAAPGIQMTLYQALNLSAIPGSWNTAVQSGAAAHSVSLVTTATNSVVLTVTTNAAAVVTAAGSSTIDANQVDTPNVAAYTSQHTVSAAVGTHVTAGVSDTAAGGAVAVEIPLTAAPTGAQLASTVVWASGYTNTSAALANTQFVVATVSALGDPGVGQVQATLTDTFGMLWTQIAVANTTGNAYAAIWIGQAPGPLAAPAAQTLPPGTVGSPYSTYIPGILGFQPYTYLLASGSLPTGMSLTNATGQVSGTPTAAGTYNYTITVTDSLGNTATSGTITHVISSSAASNPSILKVWQAQGTEYSYGTTTVPVSNLSGNWLFVVVSWTQSNDGQAQSYVTDNAHNVYRPVTYAGAYTWHQVYVVPNAKAASAVYASTSAYVRDLVVTVVEVQGLTAGYVVDVSTTADGSGSANFNMSVTTTQADFVFWVASSTAGFTTISTQPSVFSTTPHTTQAIGGQYVSTPGIFNVNALLGSPAWSQPANYSGAIIAVSVAAAPIISSTNPAWPSIHVQAAFGYEPGAPTGPPTWTDISSRFLGLSGERGRNFELDELSAADLTLTLDNYDGALSPGNSSSPYYPNVTLVTPVQVLADWQGRRYSLFTGIMTAIPQTYDFQRGITEIAVSDDFSKLPQVLLPSAEISELLYDRPLDLWPLNDLSGATQASNWSGISDAVLLPTSSKYGAGTTSSTPQTGFGNQNGNGLYPTGLEGSTDTVWGNYANVSPYILTGTCLVDRDDPNLPIHTTGATYEVWANIANDAGNAHSGAVIMSVLDDKGTNGGGCYFKVVVFNIEVSTTLQSTGIYLVSGGYSWNGTSVILAPINQLTGTMLFDNAWHHYAVTISTSKQVTLYVDGQELLSMKGSFPPAPPNRLTFGGDPTVDPLILAYLESIGTPGYTQVSATPGMFTGTMCNAAVYPRVLDLERIQAHYASGFNGFVGESSGTRIRRVLTWAGWSGPQAVEYGLSHQQIFNYLGQGYASNGINGAIGQYATAGGAAAVDNGAQSDITIQDIALSECGTLLVGADGTLSFRQRDSLYNQPYTGSLGDMDYQLNAPGMTVGAFPWNSAGTNCTLTNSTAWSYSGGTSILMTVTSGGSIAATNPAHTNVTAGEVIGASCWVMASIACHMSIEFAWTGGSGGTVMSPNTYIPPYTPMLLQMPGTVVPSGVTQVKATPYVYSSVVTGTMVWFDRLRVSPSGYQVPYLSDVEATEDIQYLYNDVAITRNIDQATYRARNLASRAQYYPRVYTRTVYTAESDPTAVVDVANWLLAGYAQPAMRITRVTVDAASNPDAWAFVLGTDIGDLISFQRTPVGGAPIQGVFMVLSVSPDIAPDHAQFTYVLAPSPSGASILTLDDPVYGLVGGTNELGW